ncbi:hypothetical protein D3C87_1460660 [compost metagenome]
MPLVAITSVQLTTPMRTVLQEASSAAMAPALNRAVPQKIERQRVNRPLGLVMDSILVRQRIIVGAVSLCTVARTLRSRRVVKANCGDRVLHGGDCHVQMLRHMKTCGSELARDEAITSDINVA